MTFVEILKTHCIISELGGIKNEKKSVLSIFFAKVELSLVAPLLSKNRSVIDGRRPSESTPCARGRKAVETRLTLLFSFLTFFFSVS